MNKLAPIVLFVYNRPWHTRQTVEALQKNELASESELFIFSDGPKNKEAEEKVREVREYIKTIDGFKKVTIIEREKNWGLAANIIDGVTKIVSEYGKIIVLEDDLVTSPYFLRFMNDALEFYKGEYKVWHISGWNYPIKINIEEDVFLWRVMNCWGWATWANKWKYYEKNADKLIREFSKEDINRFNLDGVENFWGQVIANKKGKINTWAIFWYATIFKHNGLCINPVLSFVKNIGQDGSGIHGRFKVLKDNEVLNFTKNIKFSMSMKENGKAIERIKKYYKENQIKSLITALKKFNFLKFLKKIMKILYLRVKNYDNIFFKIDIFYRNYIYNSFIFLVSKK